MSLRPPDINIYKYIQYPSIYTCSTFINTIHQAYKAYIHTYITYIYLYIFVILFVGRRQQLRRNVFYYYKDDCEICVRHLFIHTLYYYYYDKSTTTTTT